MSPGLVVLILSLLLGLQPVTTDLYLPALPAMKEGFGATMTQAQLTLSALIMANIPLALVGAVLGLWISGQPLSVAALDHLRSLTVADAYYVVLAIALNTSMVTCDGPLSRAHGHDAAIELIGPTT